MQFILIKKYNNLLITIVMVLKFKIYLTVITSPSPNGIPFIWAINIAATDSYNAVPSILTVAPTDTTKRVTRGSIPIFSSKHWNVTGNVAELKFNKLK